MTADAMNHVERFRAVMDFQGAVSDVAGHPGGRLQFDQLRCMDGAVDPARHDQVRRPYLALDDALFADHQHAAAFAADAAHGALHGAVDAQAAGEGQVADQRRAGADQAGDVLVAVALLSKHRLSPCALIVGKSAARVSARQPRCERPPTAVPPLPAG